MEVLMGFTYGNNQSKRIKELEDEVDALKT